MCNRKSKYFELVEIPVGSAVTKAAIPDQPQLRIQGDQKIRIRDIEVYSIISLPATQANTTSPLVELKKGTLVLCSKSENRINRIPLLALVTIDDGTTPYQRNPISLEGIEVDWSKSYIELSSAAATTPYAFMLGVNYEKY